MHAPARCPAVIVAAGLGTCCAIQSRNIRGTVFCDPLHGALRVADVIKDCRVGTSSDLWVRKKWCLIAA